MTVKDRINEVFTRVEILLGYAWDVAAMNQISELVKCAMISSRTQRVEILPNDLQRNNTRIIMKFISNHNFKAVNYIYIILILRFK